jgi:hypothetical protein
MRADVDARLFTTMAGVLSDEAWREAKLRFFQKQRKHVT